MTRDGRPARIIVPPVDATRFYRVFWRERLARLEALLKESDR